MLVLPAVAVVALAVAVPAAFAETYVTLDPLPSAVYERDTVLFAGTLTSDGAPLSGRTVWICEDDPFIPDTCLAQATTNHYGAFSAWWTAQAQTVELELDIYAEFRGDGWYERAQTPRYAMSVYEAAGPSPATVTLYHVPSYVYAGDPVLFMGTLTSGGVPLPGRTVSICEDDPLWPDTCLAHVTTGNDGRFYADWIAEAGIVETDYDIYAEFGGDGWYERDQTPRYTMSVYKHGGSITLDPIPDRAAFGEVVVLSGTLRLDAHNPEGAIVYIKDEDDLNPDDLLTSAYVGASGNFTTSWVVEDVDPDYTVDIQAVFEGNYQYDRLATLIQGLEVYSDPLPPEPAPVGDDGYMKLYRSLDFDQAPRVLIVPSPDSYDAVRGHIVPVREGILQFTAMMEQNYPWGDWSVEFDVHAPGDDFVGHEPDVMVNLVTRDDDSKCSDGWLGYAYYLLPKPVPTVVCSLDGRTNEQVGATAAHEFMHAIGLGHTFNIRGDLMCSVEDNVPTCPTSRTKSATPSELNLAAIAAIYGTDGFQNPNNRITFEERFTHGD